jgi:alpha-galactosidase
MTSTVLTVENDGVRLELDREAGTFSVLAAQQHVFEGATGRVELGFPVKKKTELRVFSTRGEWKVLDSGETSMRLSMALEWGELLFRAAARGGALELRLGVAWNGEGPAPMVGSMSPLHVPPGGVWRGCESLKPWRVYVNGWQCRTPSGTVRAGRPGDYFLPLFLPRSLKPMLANTSTPVSSERGRFESEWFGGLADLDGGDSVVLGFTGLTRALSRISFRLGRKPGESQLEAQCGFEGKPLENGVELWSEPLVVIPGDLSTSNLAAYADLVAEGQGAGARTGTPAGWCSWYQYFHQVTAENVRSNLALLSEKHAELDIELIQVDDGYQSEVGDWLETNTKFPGSMKEIADDITARGKVAGIWLAPFTVTRRSSIFRRSKGWLIASKRGKPVLGGISVDWRSRFYGLDLTNPEVLEHLRDVFATLTGYGYRYFKLDFLATGMLEGKRYDQTLTRAEAFRKALEAIREAVGEKSILLAAGGPVMLGAGILDAQRVGPDVGPSWQPIRQSLLHDRATPSLHNSLAGMFTRAFMSGRIFEGDPDCLLLRPSNTSLSEAEIRTLASGIAVFGGTFLVSDDVGLWTAAQEETAGRLLPHVKAHPRCPDLWKSELPRLMVTRLSDPSGDYYIAWVMNWASVEMASETSLEELGIEPARYHVHEFWTGRYLGETEGSIDIGRLPGHGSAVVRLTPATDEPRLIGSSIHVTQGAAELESFHAGHAGLSMSLACPVKTRASVVLSLPGARDLRVGSGQEASDIEISRLTTTVYKLQFPLHQSRLINLLWS